MLTARDAAESMVLARQAVAQGCDVLAVMGGDGSVHLALQAVVSSPTVLAVIPTGTGNDLARALGLPRNDPRAAARIITTGRTRLIDAARAGERYFVTVLAGGFDSRVSERARAMSFPKGQLRYSLATLAELRVFRPMRYHLTLDGASMSVEATLVAVGNTPSYGGGLRMCAGARVDDGLLDVVVIAPMSRLGVVTMYPKLFRGSHVTSPVYQHHRVRRLTVDAVDVVAYADGEPLGPLPVTVEVVPQSVRVKVAAG